MELTKNQKIVGISLLGVVGYLLYGKKIRLQSHRADTPAGPTQVVVPVATGAGTGAIANVLGNILPTAHSELVSKALNQVPLVVQNGRMAPTRISTIADIQHALNFLKVCPTPLRDTGKLDAPTVACLKAFQNIMQIPVTGLDDPTTKMTLESAVTKAGISSAAPAILSAPSVVSPPTVNPIISTERDLQRALNVLGASPKLKEDGKIGPVTTAAIKAFQVVHGLAADGLAGPQTKAALATAMQGNAANPLAAAAPVAQAAANAATQIATALQANGDFGYIPPPMTHPGIPGFMGAGGGPDYRHAFDHGWEHRFVPGIPAPPPGIPAPPPGLPAPPLGVDLRYMQSWERWQQVHPGTSRADYDGWYAQNAASGATINGDFGDFGFARAGIRGGGFRPALRGRAWGLGLLPVDDEEIDDTVVENAPVDEAIYHDHARRAYHEAFIHGDRRFEDPRIGPVAPILPGENRLHADHFGMGHPGERRGFFDRFRSWFGFGRRVAGMTVDQNPYIPPAATPPVMNWDPFAAQNVLPPAVDRWHPDDLRRREELERTGYRPAPPTPGMPAPPVINHPTPPGPPPPRN